MRKKFLLATFCALLVCFNFVFTPGAKSAWPTSAAIANLVPENMAAFSQMADTAMKKIELIQKYSDKILWQIAKAAALVGSQMAVSAILNSDTNSAPFVSNWNQYLYLSPQQRTMAYMNSLFDQSTRGRTSELNYEGVGQKFDQYMKRQAQGAISVKPIEVNLREYCVDPDNAFVGNNFRCFNAFLLPQNNPAGIVAIAQNSYQSELEKEQTIAKNKQTNGFLPKEKNGRIVTPSALLQKGFLSLDTLGTETITTAQSEDWTGIAIGVSARIAGAAMQASFGDKISQTVARQQNSAVSGYANAQINSALKTSGVNATVKLFN